MRRMLLDRQSVVLRRLQRKYQTQLRAHSDLPLGLTLLSWLVMKGVLSWAAAQSVRWMGAASSAVLIGSKVSCVGVFLSVS